MARKTRNKKIDSRTARLVLPVRREPYWTRLERGLALGYRRTATATGTWTARRYDPAATPTMIYQALGVADDTADEIGLSFDAAQKMAREWLATLSPGEAPASRSPLTVRKAFEHYVAYLKLHKSPHEAYCAAGDLVGAVGQRGKPRRCKVPAAVLDLQLTKLRKSHLTEWQASQITRTDPEGQRRQKDTANRTFNWIRAALTRAADDEDNRFPVDAARPWERVEAFKGVGRGRELHLTADQTRRLLNAIGARSALYRLAAGCFLTGLRPGNEVKALTVGDFHADEATLTLRRGKTGERTVWLNSEAVAFFTEITAGRKPNEPLFVKDDGAPWGDANEWGRPLKEAAERVGLPIGRGGVCLYTARHSHISQALVSKNRMPVQMLAENAGTSVKMIEANYGKFFDADRRRLVEAGTAKLGLKRTIVTPLRAHRGSK